MANIQAGQSDAKADDALARQRRVDTELSEIKRRLERVEERVDP
jgi:hypothetical protein